MLVRDDSSHPDDRAAMRAAFPTFQYSFSEPGERGRKLTPLWNLVQTDHFFHLEDDWLFLESGHHIRNCFDIFRHDPAIKCATLRYGKALPCVTATGVPYTEHEWDPRVPESSEENGFRPWPGWTLNPALHETAAIRALGPFPDHDWRRGEATFAYRYRAKGYKVAYSSTVQVLHLGYQSAFER